MSNDCEPYQAIVLVSFGGPEAVDEVVPFLERVTKGRNIPRERLVEVGEHYFARGGVSPINRLCRDLLAALRSELYRRGVDLPVYWGNRNSEPFLSDTLDQVAADGHQRVVAVTTSAYPSYSSCRQYREDLAAALPDGPVELQIDRVRQYATHPGFVTANTDRVLDALARFGDGDGATVSPTDPATRLVFVTHSIPTSMANTSGPDHDPDETGNAGDKGNASDGENLSDRGAEDGAYARWHREVAEAITAGVSERLGVQLQWDLTYCSRSGSPHTPWLEPDVNDHLESLAEQGIAKVVLAPIGFTSDHMEVVHDLDTEAIQTAGRVGLHAMRAGTAGVHPDFVSALVDLVVERAAVARGQGPEPAVVAGAEAGQWTCPANCCPNSRDTHAATVCGPTPPVSVPGSVTN